LRDLASLRRDSPPLREILQPPPPLQTSDADVHVRLIAVVLAGHARRCGRRLAPAAPALLRSGTVALAADALDPLDG